MTKLFVLAVLLSAACPGQNLASDRAVGSLEVVATFYGAMPTGVTVANDGRIFVNFPRWGDDVPFTVAEVKNGKTVAYPSSELNLYTEEDQAKDRLVSVQSVVVDPSGRRLWIVDTGSLAFGPVKPGGAKLIAVDLDTNQIVKEILFPENVVFPSSYVNDVRFDLHRRKEGVAFLTDSTSNGPNGIIVVDLASGKSWRRLNDHPSTKSDPQFLPVIEGQILKLRLPGQAPTRFAVGADGIALSQDGKSVYYRPLTSRHLFSVSAGALADPSKSDAEVAATVRDFGEQGGAGDGMEGDAEGGIYLSDYEHNAIRRWRPQHESETLMHDPRALWPDTLSIAADGYLYFIANQIERQPAFNAGKDLRQKPYVLFRLKVDGTRIHK